MAREQVKVGERVVFHDCEINRGLRDVVIGKLYTIKGRDGDGGWYFTDHVGDKNYAASMHGEGIFTKIVN